MHDCGCEGIAGRGGEGRLVSQRRRYRRWSRSSCGKALPFRPPLRLTASPPTIDCSKAATVAKKTAPKQSSNNCSGICVGRRMATRRGCIFGLHCPVRSGNVWFVFPHAFVRDPISTPDRRFARPSQVPSPGSQASSLCRRIPSPRLVGSGMLTPPHSRGKASRGERGLRARASMVGRSHAPFRAGDGAAMDSTITPGGPRTQRAGAPPHKPSRGPPPLQERVLSQRSLFRQPS